MNKILVPIIVSISMAAYSQCNQLVWSDEFNGNSVDLSKWAFQNGDGCPSMCGWGNGELESYTDNPKNISVANGVLTMTAIRETVGGSSFTASKIRTLGLHSWKYGRFEASMRMPLGRGLWPAFWMLSTNNQWPTTGEIDIMEYRGDIPKQTNGTLHYGLPWPNNRYDGSAYVHNQNLSDAFHTYAVEWDENQIKWYFDNTLMKTETKNPNSLDPANNSSIPWPWNTEFYIILNFAVGGGYTGNPTPSQVELTKPTFEVDYVRVYSGTGSIATLTPPVISGTSKMYTGENKTFSVQSVSGASYIWTVSGGNASIVSGQNTNSITIKNTTESVCTLSVEVSLPATNTCPAQSVQGSKTISAYKDNCTFVFNDFETNGANAANLAGTDGTASIVNNPTISNANASAKALKYVRSTNQYDIIFLDDALLRNGSDYENGSFAFELDVYSPKPAGTPVEIQVASKSAWNAAWPTGRHTVYRATTTKTNQWETLRFVLSETADANRAQFNTSVDRLIVLLNPNSTSSDTYYFDNLKRVSISSNTCLVTELEDEQSAEKEIVKVYPTVSESVFHIESSKIIEHLYVYNATGKVVFQKYGNISSFGDSFNSGMYLVVMTMSDGRNFSYKVQKK